MNSQYDRPTSAKPPGATILHVDMDCFFVSVERVLDPSLKGIPVAVGGEGERSVISSASYEARAFGVRSAMPVLAAKRLCPNLRIVHTPGDYYQRASNAVMTILESYTPIVEAVSIDEAYLDVRGAQKLFGSPLTIAASIQERIETQLGLPSSVGVAPTKQLAKLASTLAKPHGIMPINPDRVHELLHDLPVRYLHGVGRQTAEKLNRHRIMTCGDVLTLSEELLVRLIGPHQAAHIRASAQGIDPRPVQPRPQRKSIGAERTFPSDLITPEAIDQALLEIADTVGRRLRVKGYAAGGLALKVRTRSFTTTTRHHRFFTPIQDTQTIYQTAKDLIDQLNLQRAPIRLLGVQLDHLQSAQAARQLQLEMDDSWQEIDGVIDELRSRFGRQALTRGTLLRTKQAQQPLQG